MNNPTISNNFAEMLSVLQAFSTSENFEKINKVAQVISNSLKNGGVIYSCGNGGSMCDAMHFAEELSGRFRENRPPLPAIAISDSSYLTCVGNDYGFDSVFSRFIEAFGKKNDIILAISTSGNSKNILKAIQSAKDKNMIVIGLTGKDGGQMANLCDYELRVPHFGYADRIQEIHIKIIHTLIQLIEEKMFL